MRSPLKSLAQGAVCGLVFYGVGVILVRIAEAIAA